MNSLASVLFLFSLHMNTSHLQGPVLEHAALRDSTCTSIPNVSQRTVGRVSTKSNGAFTFPAPENLTYLWTCLRLGPTCYVINFFDFCPFLFPGLEIYKHLQRDLVILGPKASSKRDIRINWDTSTWYLIYWDLKNWMQCWCELFLYSAVLLGCLHYFDRKNVNQLKWS